MESNIPVTYTGGIATGVLHKIGSIPFKYEVEHIHIEMRRDEEKKEIYANRRISVDEYNQSPFTFYQRNAIWIYGTILFSIIGLGLYLASTI